MRTLLYLLAALLLSGPVHAEYPFGTGSRDQARRAYVSVLADMEVASVTAAVCGDFHYDERSATADLEVRIKEYRAQGAGAFAVDGIKQIFASSKDRRLEAAKKDPN